MLALRIEWWPSRAADVVSVCKDMAKTLLEHRPRSIVLWLQSFPARPCSTIRNVLVGHPMSQPFEEVAAAMLDV
jgi:hypothetical protein